VESSDYPRILTKQNSFRIFISVIPSFHRVAPFSIHSSIFFFIYPSIFASIHTSVFPSTYSSMHPLIPSSNHILSREIICSRRKKLFERFLPVSCAKKFLANIYATLNNNYSVQDRLRELKLISVELPYYEFRIHMCSKCLYDMCERNVSIRQYYFLQHGGGVGSAVGHLGSQK
jgi:hypothetical protein